ncbi:Na+/H+ antiporter subunit E [Rothia kristinae]|uniref:Na+/H+ antiporter subunit E n=1 Tax=Rothia kristinae TaxID=37923 RepID=A0A7T3CHV4_9MICC|nr:Na+/H+ antiporter subunit E [Rothia kristinae]QPT54476.1 Na+/H+ antiporter subunit E [Rothia kristinae]SQC36950.1 Multiple resistance and pH homeostasis protein E [Rothia kristinae]
MSWLSWPFRMLFFLLWFAKEIVVSSAAVMRDNLTPGQSSTPGIVRLRTRCRTDVEVTLLAATITLTPGTLTLGIQRDPDDGARLLYVHGLYATDAREQREALRQMEDRLLAGLRRKPADASRGAARGEEER